LTALSIAHLIDHPEVREGSDSPCLTDTSKISKKYKSKNAALDNTSDEEDVSPIGGGTGVQGSPPPNFQLTGALLL